MNNLLTIPQVPEYLLAQYSVARCIKTIRYWITPGLLRHGNRIKLKTYTCPLGQLYVRKEWVDDFMERQAI